MNWNKIHPILHTIARYFLASIILMYAVSKIMGTQFSSTPSIWDKNIGDLSGFELTWFYFGYSFWYGVFIASSQIIAAFLLFFKQTTRLGIVIYLSIMVNILVLDFTYNIEGAKGMAIILTVVALFVLLSEFRSFYNFFFEKPPVFENQNRPNWMNKISKIKYAYIPLLIIGLFTMTYFLKEKIMTKNEFYGAWQPKNHKNWERIYFQEASTFSIRKENSLEEIFSGKYRLDRQNETIEFLQFIVPEKDINVLNPEDSQMSLLFEMKYIFNEDELILKNDSVTIEIKKLK